MLDAELPKETQDCNIAETGATQDKQDVQCIPVSDRLKVKVNTGSVLSRLGTRKVTSVPNEMNKNKSLTLHVSDRLGNKVTDRLGPRKVALKPNVVANEDKVSNRLGERVNLLSEKQKISVAHVSPTSVNRQIVKIGGESKTLRRVLEDDDCKDQVNSCCFF